MTTGRINQIAISRDCCPSFPKVAKPWSTRNRQSHAAFNKCTPGPWAPPPKGFCPIPKDMPKDQWCVFRILRYEGFEPSPFDRRGTQRGLGSRTGSHSERVTSLRTEWTSPWSWIDRVSLRKTRLWQSITLGGWLHNPRSDLAIANSCWAPFPKRTLRRASLMRSLSCRVSRPIVQRETKGSVWAIRAYAGRADS